MTTTMNLFSSIVPNQNTVFLIDTSGSMYSCLATVREHLSTYLRVHAVDIPSPHQTLLFNLIEFNSDIRRWADRCVFWSHASVIVANDWLRSLVPKTGTNTLGGLLTAFADSLCQQVVLITDGIPDQEPQAILHFLQQNGQEKRPCHIFFINTPLNTQQEQETVVKFLQDLAALTRGSLTVAHFSQAGALESIAPMINYQLEDATRPLVVADTILPSSNLVPQIETSVSSEIGQLLIGQDCLARKDKDGYYYRGKILNQLNINQFMVEFGPRTVSGGFSESDFQATYLFDIIHYTDALMHNIKTGDFVLAPDGQQGRFVPGEVLDGFERRASCENQEIRRLVIHFANGKNVTLKRLEEAIWIPAALYERIKFELSIPSSARQYLQSHSIAYPAKLLPGYPPALTQLSMGSDSWPFFIPNQIQGTIAPIILAPQHAVPSSVSSSDVNNLIMASEHKPQSLMTSSELNRKVDEQIKQHWRLLGEQEPPPSPATVLHSHSYNHLPQDHHHYHHHHQQQHQHHSYSTSSSPNSHSTQKKSVCFDDRTIVRRHSVDDLDTQRSQSPLRSCLKSSTSLNPNECNHFPVPVTHHMSTKTQVTHQRPNNTFATTDVYKPSIPPPPIEQWHSRQLKSAPVSHSLHSHSSTLNGSRRQNLGHLYEKAQQEVKKEFEEQQVQREQHKREQAKEQSRRIQNRQQQEIDKAERIIDAKRQFRSQIIHENHQRVQASENHQNDRLRFKQNQYAQRIHSVSQTRNTNQARTAATANHRQNQTAQRNHTQQTNVLAEEFDRLYKDVITRKFHEDADRKAEMVENRQQNRAQLLNDIEKRRIAWSNPTVYS